MVQAKVEQYETPEKTARELRILTSAARGWSAIRAVQKAKNLQWARELGTRLQGILLLLRVRGGISWATDLYGDYVQLCAERGWPVVCERRFLQYLDVLVEHEEIVSDTRSYGRYGLRRRVAVVPPSVMTQLVDSSDRRSVSQSVSPQNRHQSYDSVSHTTHQSTPEGGTL